MIFFQVCDLFIPNISKLSEDCEGNKDTNNFFSYLWLIRQTIFPVSLEGQSMHSFVIIGKFWLTQRADKVSLVSCLLISLYFSRLFRSQTDNDGKRALYLVWRVVCKQQSSKLWRLCRGGLYANSFLMEEGGGNWLDWSFLITISIISPVTIAQLWPTVVWNLPGSMCHRELTVGTFLTICFSW